MLLNKFIGADSLSFSLHIVDESNITELKGFLKECEKDGSQNNSSLQALKFGKWGEEECWWYIKSNDANKIVSMCGAHYLPHISPKCYMLAYRVYTLKEWRGFCGNQNDHRMLSEFHHGAVQPFAVDWCLSRGADTIVTTVNTEKNLVADPNGLDYKFSRVARIVFPREGKYTLLHKDFLLYNRYQDVWKLNYKDFRTMEPL
jgi:hypothetical protein